ncbi:hypothetical protein SAMN04515667_2742 [Formosa sp. Hel1_31_208]|uniref:hypothetical protein n=1 Tax=Formosa sp. Hel1_31_208 TaxID=1798225 RepID=UPI00087A4CCC|nr:hypothetical protein [Formosa sp. Hel1_31_208]SDS68737.1 hypothetical protein SAMN04515667_2742 [Formosa sp. Hel1_31_208]
MKRFFKNVLIVIIGSAILVSVMSYGSLYALRKSAFYKPSFIANHVSQDQFDYIILGSSTGLTTLHTKAIDSIIGTTGLNLAMDDTGLSSQYIMLQHFIAQGKKSKYCILAPSASSFDVNYKDVSDNDYRFMPFANESYVHDYYKRYNSRRAELLSGSKWAPLLGVSYYNTEVFYPSLLSIFNSEKRNRFDDRGNYTYPATQRTAETITTTTALKIEFKNADIENIRALCELNGMELICYFSPMQNKEIVTQNLNYKIINHSNLLDNTMYFYDAIHVNHKGREISSARFANEFNVMIE